jgi:hypothetical protein
MYGDSSSGIKMWAYALAGGFYRCKKDVSRI